jgi:3-hydroxyacyl-[acyl-carrier-protein] dehydratase
MLSIDKIIMDVEKIKEVIPHRDPFLLLDSVHELISGKSIIASKMLLPTQPIFEGHFPGNPIYPGVYYIESIAQAGALLLYITNPETIGSLGLLSGIEETRFRKPCKPGDRVVYEVILEKKRGMFFWLKGKAYIGDEIAAEAKISVALIPKQ